VEALAAKGRLGADARVRLVRDGKSPDATAIVEVTPGDTAYLRSVVIEGYRRTRRNLVASLVDARPGTPVSPPAVDAVRQRLYALDVFSKVLVELEGEESHARDLRVTLVEKAPIYLEVGGGAATDQGARSFVRAGHRNLLGLGHRVTLVGQAGLAWVGDGWTLDATAPEWRAALRYEAPRVPRANDVLAADLLLQERQQAPAWRMERSGVGGSLRLQGTGRLAIDLGYQMQSRRLLDLDPGVLLDDEVWLGPLGLTEQGPDPRPVTPSAARVQSGPTLSVVLDRRDDAFSPRNGTLASLLLVGADPWLSERAFVRGEAGWTRWATVGGLGYQLRGRAGGGWATGNASLPLEDRFRLGGAATVRGFDLDVIGPANLVSREAVDWPEGLSPLVDWSGRDGAGRWVPTGGDVMALASAEVRVPFERLGLPGDGADLALFTDVGNTWLLVSGSRAASAALGAEPAVRVGVGFGVRQSTPIGPVQADVGFNPWRLAAREEPLARFHVTLGAL
jgi:outer membrane protein assembly factor BamA